MERKFVEGLRSTPHAFPPCLAVLPAQHCPARLELLKQHGQLLVPAKKAGSKGR